MLAFRAQGHGDRRRRAVLPGHDRGEHAERRPLHLLRPRFVTQQTRVTTAIGSQRYSATVYAVAKSDTKIQTDPGLANLIKLGIYDNLATADIILPAETAPPVPPAVRVLVMTVDADGKRKEIGSEVIKGTPLLIGFRSADKDGNVAQVSRATINGAAMGVVKDSEPSNLPVDFLLRDDAASGGFYTPASSGAYTLTAEAVPPLGGAVIPVSYTFRATAAGGGIDNLPGVAPRLLTNRTVPKAGAGGVPVTVFAELAFSEPVTSVFGNVLLVDTAGQRAPVRLVGMTAPAAPRSIDLQDGNHPPITAVTIVPQVGLKYGEGYRLEATSDILDLDRDVNGNPAPLALDCSGAAKPCVSTFTTFGPAEVGGADPALRMAGLAVLGDRAYALETQYAGGVAARLRSRWACSGSTTSPTRKSPGTWLDNPLESRSASWTSRPGGRRKEGSGPE